MKIGDRVTWTSRGRAVTTKQGVIVRVIKAGEWAGQKGLGIIPTPYKYQYRGELRDHESYLVIAFGKHGPYLYWPRVSNLRIQPEPPECSLSEGRTVDKVDSAQQERERALRHPLFPQLNL
jgi:hypothetical protein